MKNAFTKRLLLQQRAMSKALIMDSLRTKSTGKNLPFESLY
jgi:hypothetical protein